MLATTARRPCHFPHRRRRYRRWRRTTTMAARADAAEPAELAAAVWHLSRSAVATDTAGVAEHAAAGRAAQAVNQRRVESGPQCSTPLQRRRADI